MATRDLHSALKTSVVTDLTSDGVRYKHVRLQHGKDEFVDSLHAHPTSYSSSGLQTTDFFRLTGFDRAQCAFHGGECFCRQITRDADVPAMVAAISSAYKKLDRAAEALECCGILIDRPEGWGYFFGKPANSRSFHPRHPSGDGHVAPQVERMKGSEDVFFRFVFSWIDGGPDKGWTTHYRAKHMPLAPEFKAALDFVGGFRWFSGCPEFDFEGCWWRFTAYREEQDSFPMGNAEHAHRYFDAHSTKFSQGLEQLLAAHTELHPHGISFLRIDSLEIARGGALPRAAANSEPMTVSPIPDRFDVAISFAGTERGLAEELARCVRGAGFAVFYDAFYPEQLWGKDLAAFFDRVYRKSSRYCVVFVSREYAERMWTTHERRSAQARALQEKGQEYILPVRVDETDLDGLPPTVGFLSMKERSIQEIASLLVAKLKGSH